MDNVEIKSFIFKITKEQADEIVDSEKDKPPTRIGLLCGYGAIVPDSAEVVVEYNSDGSCYVASIDNLVRGSDEIFCYLKRDVNEVICSEDLPKFSDVFKVRKL